MPNAAVTLNLRELRDLGVALRQSQPELAKEIRGELKKAGNIVAEEARTLSSFSSRIPGSIKVRTSGFNVTVRAGGDDAPEAAAFENRGDPGTFRHPVFGNRDVWVSQRAHPFLVPALVARADSLVDGVVHALDLVFSKLGFR